MLVLLVGAGGLRRCEQPVRIPLTITRTSWDPAAAYRSPVLGGLPPESSAPLHQYPYILVLQVVLVVSCVSISTTLPRNGLSFCGHFFINKYYR